MCTDVSFEQRQTLIWYTRSVISNYVLNPFWTWFVTLWPLSIAPNMVSSTHFWTILILICGFLDHTIGLPDSGHQFCELVVLWPSFSDGERWSEWAATMDLFHASQPCPFHPQVRLTSKNTCSWAIGLFAYQSFDAIDGKQARRTGMAGPLGEMFDHGEFHLLRCPCVHSSLTRLWRDEYHGSHFYHVLDSLQKLTLFYS